MTGHFVRTRILLSLIQGRRLVHLNHSRGSFLCTRIPPTRQRAFCIEWFLPASAAPWRVLESRTTHTNGIGSLMTESGHIRVLVVDDHPVVRRGLHSMLDGESGISVIGMASSGKEGLQTARELNPDVVLLDLRMPDMSGVEVAAALRAARSESRILILTNYQLDEDIFKAIEAGALGYLLKSASQEEVVDAIRAVSEGKRRIPAALATRLAEHMGRSALSAREQEVLELLVQGQTNKEIAQALGISDITVRNHVVNLLSKLNAKDRTEAATIAIRRGLVKLKE